MPLHKYLYLSKFEHVPQWVGGGRVPIKLASSYLSPVRSGIFTPDETLIHDSPHDLTNIPGVILNNVKGITFTGCYSNGKKIPEIFGASYYREDGVILSFSNRRSSSIAKRLRKVACVKVLNMHALKDCLDRQIGVEGMMAHCQYTDDHQRNHFLKSVEDQWQDEFRIFWPHIEPIEVDIPPRTARAVNL